MLNLQAVTHIRQTALALKELRAKSIVTTETSTQRVNLERELIEIFSDPDTILEFVAAFYCVHTEYVPLVSALVPVFQRSSDILHQRIAVAQAHEQAAAVQAQAQLITAAHADAPKEAAAPADSNN